MSFHRLVALTGTAALLGLLGIAQASNFNSPKESKIVVEAGLRERIQKADIQGCGG